MTRYVRIAAAIAVGWSTAAFAQGACPVVSNGVSTGIPQNAALTELSGMAASRQNPGVLWVHNDSGDGARVYAMRSDGTHLGTYDLQGASAVDYEDIALGPGPTPGVDYLYIGDIGDNSRVRSSVVVYRVPEPSVNVSQAPVTVTLTGVSALPMQYPSTAFDCETLLLDPLTADLYLVTKDVTGSGDNGTSFIFHSPAPHAVGATATLAQVGSINLGSGLLNRATGGDISPSGHTIIVRSYNAIRSWSRDCGTSIAEAMTAAPCMLPLQGEPQGESVAFAGDSAGYFTVSEFPGGTPQPINSYAIQALNEPVCPNEITSGAPVEGFKLILSAPSPGSNYQWKKNGSALPENAPRVTGTTTNTLIFDPLLQADAGAYTCAYDNGLTIPVETGTFTMNVLVVSGLPLPSQTWTAVLLLVLGIAILRHWHIPQPHA